MNATEIFNKIQSKNRSIEIINNWLNINPSSCINDEMIESRNKKMKEVKVLEKQLDQLFNENI